MEPIHTAPEQEKAAEAMPVRTGLRDWVKVFVIALGAALFIRTFCYQAFRIPTPSMEKNLLVGDFVLVSKLHYGPRCPASLGIPLTDYYLHGVKLPLLRMPGFTRVKRGDVIVFNYPLEGGLLDRKTHYIKRVAALPGDTLSIVDKVVSVNRTPWHLQQGMQQRWVATGKGNAPLPVGRLAEAGAEHISMLGSNSRSVTFEGTPAVAATVELWGEIEGVRAYTGSGGFGPRVFPNGSGFGRDNYGPLYVPARGDTLILTPQNWPAYKALITRYEGHEAYLYPDGSFEIDGVRTNRYVVQQDYYFVLGDNRDSSADSRVWGYVPQDHIVGKAVLVYFSWDEMEGKVRLPRILSRVH
jgi:signal peptidase I